MHYERDRDMINNKIIDLKSRTMRDNLIFYGITEGGTTENCTSLVKNLIETQLCIKTEVMKIDRAHRLTDPIRHQKHDQ